MLIYAFRDARGTWHGDPDAVIRELRPGRGPLTLPPTAPGREPGVFDGQRVEVLYAACDLEASETSYRLDDGDAFLATWHVHELLSPAYRRVSAAPDALRNAAAVRLEIGSSHRRYSLHADLPAEGRVEITVVVCTTDGVIRGELTGELDTCDLSEVGRLIASAPIASAPIASAPIASAPIASAPIASAPIASAPIASAPIASAPIASAPIASAPIASAPIASAPIASAVETTSSAASPAPAKVTRHGQAWTPEAITYLEEHYRAGKGSEHLAEELGRSEKSIRWKLYGLKLAPYPGDLVPDPRPAVEPEVPKAYTVEAKRQLYPNAYKPWEPEDEQRLAKRCAQGASLPVLAQEFGRNEGAIASRLLKIQAEGPAADDAREYGG